MVLQNRPADTPQTNSNKKTPSNFEEGKATQSASLMAEVHIAEAKSRQHEQPDAALSELDTVEETARHNQLVNWLKLNFPAMEAREKAAELLLDFEAEMRGAGLPEFDIAKEPISDTAAFIEAELEADDYTSLNDSVAGQIADGVPAKIPAEAGEQSRLIQTNEALGTDHSTLSEAKTNLQLETNQLKGNVEATKARNETGEQELARLKTTFDELRKNTGSLTALQAVYDQATLPEVKQRIGRVLATATALQTALPEKSGLVTRLINQSDVDFTATSMSVAFAGFISAAETSEDFTAEEITTFRHTLNQSDRNIKTGSDVRSTALQTTLDPNTGETVPLHTKDDKAEVAPGVYTYTETGSEVILELQEGSAYHRVDVTGLDSQSLGVAAEVLGLAADAETQGASGFIRHVHGLDIEGLNRQGFDPLTLISLRNKLSNLLGGGAGHDGGISKPAQRRQLLREQMSLVAPNGSLSAWEDDPEGFRKNATQLGLNHAPVLEAFGQFTRQNSGQGSVDRNALQRHLHRRFPDLVADPNGNEVSDLVA